MRELLCERSVGMRCCGYRHRQVRACMHAAACARVRGSVRDGVRARRHTADASRASRQSHLTASLVYESSEGGEESAYDDHMSLEHLCTTCRAARAHARRASDHSCQPASSALRRLQSLHELLTRRWAQMEAPPQCTHLLLTRLCSQMEPPQSLHLLLNRLCSQMEAPPQSLHVLLSRLCSQMEAPPQSLHPLLSRLCSQMEAPPQSLHLALSWLCSQMEAPETWSRRWAPTLCSIEHLRHLVPANLHDACFSQSTGSTEWEIHAHSGYALEAQGHMPSVDDMAAYFNG